MRFHQAILWSIVYVMCKNNYLYLMLKYFLLIFAFEVIFSRLKAVFSLFFTLFRRRRHKISLFSF